MRLPWLWSVVIMLSTLAAGLATMLIPGTIAGTIVIIWFLFVCPGMVLVRTLDLNMPGVEWTLALALSVAIDAIVSGTLLYAGMWSPPFVLYVLIGFCLSGGIIQLISLHPALIAKQFAIPHIARLGTLFVILLTLLVSMSFVRSFWSYDTHPSSHSALAVKPHQMLPRAHSISTVVPTPTLSPTPSLTGTYYGTIYSLTVNLSTKMSLTGVQHKNKENVSGTFTGLSFSAPFKGAMNDPEHIHFTAMDTEGQVILSFDGTIQADGNLAGSYCSTDQQGQCNGKYGYGLWSVAPR